MYKKDKKEGRKEGKEKRRTRKEGRKDGREKGAAILHVQIMIILRVLVMVTAAVFEGVCQ